MANPALLALFPFIPRGMLAVDILRALRAQGFNAHICLTQSCGGAYTPDPLTDFSNANALLDLRNVPVHERKKMLLDYVESANVHAILQVGAYEFYSVLPLIKERMPHVRILDILYNDIGHTQNHFLFENCIDEVLVESEMMADFVRRSSQKPRPAVTKLASGIDLNHFQPSFQRIASGQLNIGYVGRMSPEKNPLAVIQVAESHSKTMPGLKCVLYGGGPMASEVTERVAQSAANGSLEYRGFVDDVRDAFASIDALILPSKTDGRPVAVMEANACGLPVLATRVGGLPEMIEDGGNGRLLSNNFSELTAIFQSWMADDRALEAAKRAARAHAEAHFDREAMLGAYRAVFERNMGLISAPQSGKRALH